MKPSLQKRWILATASLVVLAGADETACSQLKPGDVFVWTVASDDPDGVGFLALEAIPAGLELYMTDNAWNGTAFATNEGTEKLVVPATGYAGGARFGYGFDYGATETWVTEQGLFNLGVDGDSLILYCLGPNQVINPLVAFSNTGSWATPGLQDYGSQQSALPEALWTVGNVVLPHFDTYEYTGPSSLTKSELQLAMMDPNNWKGTDDGLGDVPKSAARTAVDRRIALGLVAVMVVYYGTNL